MSFGIFIERLTLQDIADAMHAEAMRISKETAEAIADEIRSNLWRDGMPVHVDPDEEVNLLEGDGYVVEVGSTSQFWAGFAEFGTIDQAPDPVVTPASERQTAPHTDKMRRLFQ